MQYFHIFPILTVGNYNLIFNNYELYQKKHQVCNYIDMHFILYAKCSWQSSMGCGRECRIRLPFRITRNFDLNRQLQARSISYHPGKRKVLTKTWIDVEP